MTREEAIEILEHLKNACGEPKWVEAFELAIKALEQEQIDKVFSKTDIDSIIKAVNEGWELRVNEVLDKIRAEIVEMWQNEPCVIEGGCLDEILEVIDKYKAESEE